MRLACFMVNAPYWIITCAMTVNDPAALLSASIAEVKEAVTLQATPVAVVATVAVKSAVKAWLLRPAGIVMVAGILTVRPLGGVKLKLTIVSAETGVLAVTVPVVVPDAPTSGSVTLGGLKLRPEMAVAGAR